MSEVPSAEKDAGTRSPAPGTVAVVSMMRRRAAVALFDGVFWRSCDSYGPIKCVPLGITSIETPYVFSPVETRAESDPRATNGRVSTAQSADGDSA